MLRIDRVRTDLELVPPAATPAIAKEGSVDVTELRRLVLEILRDELRALERRGAL
jgi:hypothetical protein